LVAKATSAPNAYVEEAVIPNCPLIVENLQANYRSGRDRNRTDGIADLIGEDGIQVSGAHLERLNSGRRALITDEEMISIWIEGDDAGAIFRDERERGGGSRQADGKSR
jgi:hypothetical protein